MACPYFLQRRGALTAEEQARMERYASFHRPSSSVFNLPLVDAELFGGAHGAA
jgi:hypothetical protein